MSRLGKKPVMIPSGVNVSIDGRTVSAKGPKGNLQLQLDEQIEAKIEGNEVLVALKETGDAKSSMHGLYRQLLNNLVEGVAKGFEIKLQMIGVGYRAAVQGKMLDLQVGNSHPTQLAIPTGVDVKVDKNTTIIITGCDKHLVGQFAANVRFKKPPEPYKGKGIRYENEYVRRKAGKAGKK